jgi:hypothetical protein
MKRKPGGVISQLGEGVNEMSDTLHQLVVELPHAQLLSGMTGCRKEVESTAAQRQA